MTAEVECCHSRQPAHFHRFVVRDGAVAFTGRPRISVDYDI